MISGGGKEVTKDETSDFEHLGLAILSMPADFADQPAYKPTHLLKTSSSVSS